MALACRGPVLGQQNGVGPVGPEVSLNTEMVGMLISGRFLDDAHVRKPYPGKYQRGVEWRLEDQFARRFFNRLSGTS